MKLVQANNKLYLRTFKTKGSGIYCGKMEVKEYTDDYTDKELTTVKVTYNVDSDDFNISFYADDNFIASWNLATDFLLKRAIANLAEDVKVKSIKEAKK